MIKKKFSYSYALVFLIATLSLSGFFNADTYFERGQDSQGYIVSLSNLALFIASIVYMAFCIYVDEKAAGNLRSKFGLFEYFLRSRHAERVIRHPERSEGSPSLGGIS